MLYTFIIQVKIIAINTLNTKIIKSSVFLAIVYCAFKTNVSVKTIMKIITGRGKTEFLSVSFKIINIRQFAHAKIITIIAFKTIMSRLSKFGNLVCLAIRNFFLARKLIGSQNIISNTCFTIIIVFCVRRTISN